MAQIENDASNRLVTGTSYNDSIRNGGYGADTILNESDGQYGKIASISGDAGADKIYNFFQGRSGLSWRKA